MWSAFLLSIDKSGIVVLKLEKLSLVMLHKSDVENPCFFKVVEINTSSLGIFLLASISNISIRYFSHSRIALKLILVKGNEQE